MNTKTLATVSGIALLLGIPSGWPYVYYQLLRWVVTISGVCIAYKSYKNGKSGWVWAMVAIIILFNPITPIFLSKEKWVLIDITTAIIMFSYFKTEK